MKSRLPRFTVLVALVALLHPPEVRSQADADSGQELLRQAARNLAQQPSLEAKIRQRVAIFGQYLVGSGSYRQLTIGQSKRLRLEMKLHVAADQTTSLLQVSDGRTLWIKQDAGDQQSLAYVNLRRVRAAIAEDALLASQADGIGVGGLDFLLRGLDEAFEFDTPQPQMMGDVPVWELHGRWRAEKLRDWIPKEQGGAAEQLEQLPDHLPHTVVVTLGRDEFFPLFPYRVEYRRHASASPTAPSSPTRQPDSAIVTIELYEVRNYRVDDPRHFEFHLNDQPVVDVTDEYLARLRVGEGQRGEAQRGEAHRGREEQEAAN
jgi:hypothetical protein